MNRNLRRMLLLSVALALIGTLIISTAAFAQGPNGGARTRDQHQTQTQQQTQDQVRAQQRTRSAADQPCCDGNEARAGATSENGNTYGPGDGTGPIGDGQFGPGPRGKCLDVNNNGICDCQE